MLTETEQKILDNAPEGATHYLMNERLRITNYSFLVGEMHHCKYQDDSKKPVHYDMGSWAVRHCLDYLRKKQGKTAWDAVNEYRADLRNVKGVFRDVSFICEFNQCVKEMSCIGGDEAFECYVRRKKSPLKPVGYVPSPIYTDYMPSATQAKEGLQNLSNALNQKDNKMSEEKPVYTQAMKDAGELPSVGMLCGVNFIGGNIFHHATINYISKSGFVFTDNETGKEFFTGTVNKGVLEFFNVDTRTPEQKQVDITVNEVMSWSNLKYDDALIVVGNLQSRGLLKELK